MKFLSKLLATGKSDPLGLDATLDGIRQLKARLADERAAVEKERDRLRDAALDDPSAELSADGLLAKEKRTEAIEAALEKALIEGARAMDARQEAIEKMIEQLKGERADLARQRDREFLRVLREFIEKTGGSLEEIPRRHNSGVIRIPAVAALTDAEVQEALGDMPKPGNPAQTATSQKLAGIVKELDRLTTLRHFGSRQGLETLLG